MAQHQENKQHQQHQAQQHTKAGAIKDTQVALRRPTPMIVDRVYRIPVVNMAISVGYSQYDKLKSSSVTVGEVISRAEGWAAFVWQKVAPIVEKFQEPINKADKLACNTFDFVEGKIHQMGSVINQNTQTVAAN